MAFPPLTKQGEGGREGGRRSLWHTGGKREEEGGWKGKLARDTHKFVQLTLWLGEGGECMWTCIPKDTGRENKLEKKDCSSLRSMPVSSSAGSIFRHEMSLSRASLFMPLLYFFGVGGRMEESWVGQTETVREEGCCWG